MVIRTPRLALLAAALPPLAAPALAADKPFTAQAAVSFFIEAQDQPAFTADELAARAKTLGDEPEAIAADGALNQWKTCVADALVRWAPLNQGPGTLIDGAFGRCAEVERDYRTNLMRLSPGGRQVIDIQLARTMTKGLEDGWRPRLVAAVLDQMLAVHSAATAGTAPVTPARDPAVRGKEERGPSRP